MKTIRHPSAVVSALSTSALGLGTSRAKRLAVAVCLVAILAAPLALAECREREGSILMPYPDPADTGLFAVVETVAPGAVPNGVYYYSFHVEGGHLFSIRANNPEAFVIGLADECPGPDWSPQGLVTGEDSPEDVWLLCHNIPDFDVQFTGGEYGNGPGDEAGIVPGHGDAIVTLFFGKPGSSFTYTECD